MAENVFENISRAYYDLTAAEKKTADYVMKHHDETQYMSIAELADASGVAEATVSRFCRRLGYKGYNAFKLAIANAAAVGRQEGDQLSGQIREDDSLEDMSRKLYSADVAAMAQTLERLDPGQIAAAVDCLEAAGKVLCMGQGGSMVMAAETAHLFSTVSGKFFPVSDSHSQVIAAANMDENDPDYGIVILRVVEDENGDELFESIDDEEQLQDVYEHFMVLLFDDEDEDE